MKNLFYLCFICLFFYYLINDPTPAPYEEPIVIEKGPDTSREVHHYDWAAKKYIYKDEIPPEPKREYTEELDYYPDYTVEIKQPGPSSDKPRYMVVDGQRYRIYYQPNGTQKLVKSR